MHSKPSLQKVLLTLVAISTTVVNGLLIEAPKGPYAVSMSVEDLTDSSREDPYAPTNATHQRRVLISTFMPINQTHTPCARNETVPYMTPRLAQGYDEVAVSLGLSHDAFSSLELEYCVPRPKSHCRPGPKAPAFPLAIFSPGFGNSRLLHSIMARELASHGYAVVTIDHPYDPAFVEFPDGTVIPGAGIEADDASIEALTNTRAHDISFVLDHIRSIPSRISGIDTCHILVFGHSLGGASSAVAMGINDAIQGGIDLDGTIFEPALSAGVDRPFLLVGKPENANDEENWMTFYNASSSSKAFMGIEGTTHSSYTDMPSVIRALDSQKPFPAEVKALLHESLGDIAFGRTTEIVVALVAAFSDLLWEGKQDPVFKAENKELPEVSVTKVDL